MKRNQLLLALLCSYVLAFTAGCVTTGGQEWEYKTMRRLGRFQDSDVDLNKLGNQGWEVVEFAHPPANPLGGDLETTYLLKRRKR